MRIELERRDLKNKKVFEYGELKKYSNISDCKLFSSQARPDE